MAPCLQQQLLLQPQQQLLPQQQILPKLMQRRRESGRKLLLVMASQLLPAMLFALNLLARASTSLVLAP